MSGPAASLMGMQALLHTDEDALLLDVGGTTTDIFFLADGVPLFEPLGIQIGSYKTLVRAIFSQSIGLGGDSFVRVEKGRLKIGPQRLGPPLAFGGENPTPTDAMVVLGYLPEGDKTKAYEGMAGLARSWDGCRHGSEDDFKRNGPDYQRKRDRIIARHQHGRFIR